MPKIGRFYLNTRNDFYHNKLNVFEVRKPFKLRKILIQPYKNSFRCKQDQFEKFVCSPHIHFRKRNKKKKKTIQTFIPNSLTHLVNNTFSTPQISEMTFILF